MKRGVSYKICSFEFSSDENKECFGILSDEFGNIDY